MQFQTPSGATHDGCPELPTPIADYQPSLRFLWLAAIVTILKPMIIIAAIPLLIGIAGIFLLAIAIDAIKNPLTKPQITFTGKKLPPLN